MEKNSLSSSYEEALTESDNNKRSALLGLTIAVIGTMWLVAVVIFLMRQYF